MQRYHQNLAVILLKVTFFVHKVAHKEIISTYNHHLPYAQVARLFVTDAAEREQRVLADYAEPRGGRATY